MKSKKIAERAKKKNPGKKDEKALSKKKRPGSAKGAIRKKGLNVTERKEIEAGLEKTRKELAVIKKVADEASEFAKDIIDTVREPLLALDQDLRIVKVNRSFFNFFKVKPEETVGQHIYDLGDKQWNIPKLRELLETILPQKTTFDNYEVEHEFSTIGRRVMLLNARQINRAFGKERIILLAIEDITEHKRLEILLAESEELYRSVFKTASDGIVLLEKREGKITHANPAAKKMLGYSAKECIGNKLHDIGFMLDLSDFQATVQKLNKNGIINYEDVPAKTKSGQHIVTDIYLVNKTKVVQCNIRDITNRTRAEEALRNSEKNFRRSLDDSPLGVRIVTPNGETIYANRTILDFYGYDSMDEINRIPLKERYTPQSYAEFQMRKKDRERGDSGPNEYKINIVRKDGEIRHLQVLRKEILWNGTKQFQVVYQDITERMRANDALKESELRFKSQYEGIPIPTFTWQKQGEDFELIDFNDAAKVISDEKAIEFVGRKASDLYIDRQDILHDLKQSFVERKIIRRESSSEHFIPGKLIAMTIVPIPPDLVMVYLDDITERRQAEEKIRNSLAKKEVLLKEVHHRVKNNLMIIIGLIKMQETKSDNEMFNNLLKELDGRIRAMALVHESLHKSTDLAHIDLQNYIETISAQITAQFGADRNIHFSAQAVGVELGLDVAVPCGLILNELITNAYKHAFPGDKPRAGEDNCEIKVIVEQEGGVLTLTVANNGVGLPADLDLEKSETLGLRLIQMLSHQINGSIELDCSAGTAFRLKFPVIEKIN